MFDKTISHAQFTLPKAQVHASHPFRNADNHQKLLEYIKQRLAGDSNNRDARVERYSQIDRDVAAWLKLSDEDRKRQIEHEKTGKNYATQVSLPLTWVHIDDMMTYFAQTFAPSRGMFYHTASPDSTKDADQVVAVLNNHAVYGSYYRHLLRTIYNILKYNNGGLVNVWGQDFGPKIETQANGTQSLTQQVIFAGNKINALDMYNVFYDPAVEPTQLHKDGEWFALAEMKSHYWLKNKCLEGAYFNCEKLFESGLDYAATYYKSPPVESRMEVDESSNLAGKTNWFAWMSGTNAYLINNAFELVTCYIRINPNDFGLIGGTKTDQNKRNNYEVWRVTIANGETIIEATYMNNMHGYLPAFFGVLNDDFMQDSAKSSAEILNPLQQFSSFLLNAHVLANRKNIYGTTYYDPSRLDYDKIPEGEVAARIPIKPQGYGQDIRTMVYKEQNTLDTKQTLQDLQGIMGLIDQFFPTQSLPSQIAGIDRAIDSQVAAVQQGSNRRQHKGARLLDDAMMRPMRFAMYYNIIQFIEDQTEVADYFTGKSLQVDLASMRESSVIAMIGQGLKSIDRQAVAQQMRDLIFAMIQSPTVGAEVNLLAMMDYWISMMDVDANMQQFQKTPQQMAASAAAQGGGDGTGIQPATDPAAVAGGPIYS